MAAHLMDVLCRVLSHLALEAPIPVAQVHSRPHISACMRMGTSDSVQESTLNQGHMCQASASSSTRKAYEDRAN